MSKQDYATFDLTVDFTVAAGSVAPDAAEATIAGWCTLAESLFNDAPALRIARTVQPLAAPLTAADLTFGTAAEFRRYMDEHYDNVVGDHRTEGSFQVLVVDDVTI